MAEPAIRAENLSKRYHIGALQPAARSLREAVVDVLAAPLRRFKSFGRSSYRKEDTIWALRDVSFDVQRGEVMGIIGANGAGKSTLLKILSRITAPTDGTVCLHGRVSSLLEVGTGFHQELTGRENIYLSGAILGMSRREIGAKFDEIVEFSGVGKFIDTPVKRYSSGMMVRLGFAVAAHLEPEILLVDEVLAVGDAAFQKKCLGKMDDVARGGRTVLFVSHSMAAVENLCPRAILLDSGRAIADADSSSVVQLYLSKVFPGEVQVLSERLDRSGDGRVRLTSFHVEDPLGRRVAAVKSGMDCTFVFGYRCADGATVRRVDAGFGIHSITDTVLSVIYSSYTGEEFDTVPPEGEFRCRLSHLPLAAGRYAIRARLAVDGETADFPDGAVGYLDVELGDFYGTGSPGFGPGVPFLIRGSWSVRRGE